MPRNTAPDACGGFEKLELHPKPVDLLNGRLRITPLSGFEGRLEDTWVEPLAPPTAMSWAPPASVLEQRLTYRRGAGELEIYTRDLLAYAPQDLARTLHRNPAVAALTLEELQLERGGRLVLATPDELDLREGRAVLAFAHSVLPDNTLQVTYVTANGAVLDAGAAGCSALARELLLSLSPGRQRWELRRRVVEFMGMTLAIPHSYAFVRQWHSPGDAWTYGDATFRVMKLSPLLGAAPELVLTNVRSSDIERDPNAVQLPTRLFGRAATWFETRAPGRIVREAQIVRGDRGELQLFLVAETDDQVQELSRVASSLRWRHRAWDP